MATQRPKAGGKQPDRRPKLKQSKATKAQATQSASRFMSSREKQRAAEGSESLVPASAKIK